MPGDAPRAKLEGAKALGGEVVTYDRYHENREEIGARLAAENNAAIIPPFDYAPVISGQGTMGDEIGEECKARGITPDQLICSTGGGGLLAGVSIAFHEHFPEADIFAAEPENFDDFRRSLESGKMCRIDPEARSICDSILAPQPGEITFPINQAHCSGGLVFSDDDALDAMGFAWTHYKIVAEPGGAAGLAVAINGSVTLKDKITVVVISGGNVDRAIFERALARL
jgi:threonine dehydratase